MSVESEIIEALELFKNERATREKCKNICASLGIFLRNNELGRTQIPVVYYILGRCNEQLINYWGAARAFKKVSMDGNSSERQSDYASDFIFKFVEKINREILRHQEESDRLWNRRIKMQITE